MLKLNVCKTVAFIVKTWNFFRRDLLSPFKDLTLQKQPFTDVSKRSVNKNFVKFAKKHQHRSVFSECLLYRIPFGDYFELFGSIAKNISRHYTKDIEMATIEAILATLMPTLNMCLSVAINLEATMHNYFS